MIFCVYEDRVQHLVGVKLAVLSLARHCPGVPVVVSSPDAPESFRRWVRTIPTARLVDDPTAARMGWNAKPTILLRRLEEADEVVWIDADLLVTADIRPLLNGLDRETLVVAEDVYWGERQGGFDRTLAWGLPPGRPLPAAVNSAVIRVTGQHEPVLQAWRALLEHPTYARAQREPVHRRPLHMNSDQEALTALLSSQACATVPVRMLRRGIDIAHCFGPSGFTPLDRVRSARRGLPPIVHSMGSKPWERAVVPEALWSGTANRLRTYYDQVHLELSPYTAVARQYRAELGDGTGWLDPSTTAAKLCRTAFAHHPVWQELPLALVDSAFRHFRRARGVADHVIDPDYCLPASDTEPVTSPPSEGTPRG